MRRPKLFIVCENPKCRRRRYFTYPSQVKRYRFCSRRCIGAVYGGVRHLSLEARRAAAEKSKQVRRARALVRWQGMTPIQIARQAYSMGWKAGVRSARRRMDITEAA